MRQCLLFLPPHSLLLQTVCNYHTLSLFYSLYIEPLAMHDLLYMDFQFMCDAIVA